MKNIMSNTAFYGISIFACGAIFGAAVSMTYFKKKYETNSVNENFKKESKENSEKTISEEEIRKRAKASCNKENISKYTTVINNSGYTAYSDSEKTPEEDSEKTIPEDDDVRFISPDDFDDLDEESGYDKIDLTYFNDGVLADDENNEINKDEISQFVPEDFADHFGEFDDEAVYVRNDRLKVDYEILKDLRNFADVVEDLGD